MFAVKGLHGAKTADLARVAGVSEALLYQHFRSKEEMYGCLDELDLVAAAGFGSLDALKRLPPTTKRLVLTVRALMHAVSRPERPDLQRLLVRSLLGDGHIAGLLLRRIEGDYRPLLTQALNSAFDNGDLYPGVEPPDLGIWLPYHTVLGLSLLELPGHSPAPYAEVPPDILLDNAVSFALRGLGLREEVIRANLQEA